MKNSIHNILIACIALNLSVSPAIVFAKPEPVPAIQTDKQKAAAQKQKEAEKKKKEAEKAKAAREKEKAKAAAQKQKEADKRKAEAAKAAAAKQKEADKAAAERAKAAAEREEERAKKEAENREKEEKAIRDYEAFQNNLANPKNEVISLFGIGIRGGYAAMMDRITPMEDGSLWGAGTLNTSNALQHVKGGGGAGLDVTYNLEYGHFRFETGLDFRFLNSTSNYGFQATYKGEYTTYSFLFDNLRETRNMMQVGLPVMFGGQFDRYYFLVGAKIHYSLSGNYSHKGKYDIIRNPDPDMYGDEGRGLGIRELSGNPAAPIVFRQPDVSLAAEIGIDLDEWLQKQPSEDKDARKARQQVKAGQRMPFGREHIHYRVGLFAEYSLLNANATPAAKPVVFASDELIVEKTNTMLAMNGNTRLNNLFVGAKFTVQFEVPGKKARPVPPPPSYVIYSVVDAETNEPLATAFVETTGTNSGKIAMREKQIGPKGFRQKHALGTFLAEAKADGYIADTKEFTIEKVGSTQYVTIALQPKPVPPVLHMDTVAPPKTGDIFIVQNLLFATNKTQILPSSEKALDDLYNYLQRNQEARIRIVGHTDNIGRDASNQRLSEGRAKAVKKELVERGMDAGRIETEGRGEREPIDTNDTETGRQNNRRVEIEIL